MFCKRKEPPKPQTPPPQQQAETQQPMSNMSSMMQRPMSVPCNMVCSSPFAYQTNRNCPSPFAAFDNSFAFGSAAFASNNCGRNEGLQFYPFSFGPFSGYGGLLGLCGCF